MGFQWSADASLATLKSTQNVTPPVKSGHSVRSAVSPKVVQTWSLSMERCFLVCSRGYPRHTPEHALSSTGTSLERHSALTQHHNRAFRPHMYIKWAFRTPLTTSEKRFFFVQHLVSATSTQKLSPSWLLKSCISYGFLCEHARIG